jgi:carbamate kinase
MLIVTALGGHALRRRGQPITPESQREHVRIAARSLAKVAETHDLVVGHGNGPQASLLALERAASRAVESASHDVCGAQAEGMIGYMIEQELGNVLPHERPFATVLTMTEVDARDPAFRNPTRFIGPGYAREEADRIAGDTGWTFRQDGDQWRRVVASPDPKRVFDLRPIKWLLEHHTVVIAAGGGGVPTAHDPGNVRKLKGLECVVDKDLATEILARDLKADLYVMLTDADAVYVDWGRPTQRAIRRATPEALSALKFPPGSMGPKVDAACRFVRATGKRAAIGSLSQLDRILAGEAGTTVDSDAEGLDYAPLH